MSKNMFAIGIPTLNRVDLLHPALLYYLIDFPNTKIYVLDNGNQDIKSKISHKNIEVIVSDKNLGVSSSWNFLCKKIYENHDYAMILNDDIYLGKEFWQIENLLINFQKDFYVNEQDCCVFILPKKTYEEIGEFDENFYPAYYEDGDYFYRLWLKQKEIFRIPFLNPMVYRKTQSLLKDDTLQHQIQKNLEYFISKWGEKPKNMFDVETRINIFGTNVTI